MHNRPWAAYAYTYLTFLYLGTRPGRGWSAGAYGARVYVHRTRRVRRYTPPSVGKVCTPGPRECVVRTAAAAARGDIRETRKRNACAMGSRDRRPAYYAQGPGRAHVGVRVRLDGNVPGPLISVFEPQRRRRRRRLCLKKDGGYA